MSGHRVCPWWCGYLLASPIRRWWDNPPSLVRSYVSEGMTVLEPGPGMGYFSLELLRAVGPSGRVVAAEIQPRMLDGLRRRAAKAGLAARLDARLVQPDSLGISDLEAAVDFALAFAVVHEMPGAAPFFNQVSRALKPGGRLLLVEPGGHVNVEEFETELRHAGDAGLRVVSRPRIRLSRAALLEKDRVTKDNRALHS